MINVTISQKPNLKFHIVSKHGNISYHCHQCEYKATLKRCLKLHIKSKHGNITYPCAQCEYTTTWKWILNRHIESVHVNISNLFDQCEYNIRQLRNFLLILYITLTQLHLYPMWILNNSEGKFVTAYLI